jgi:hypothetical protein
VINQDAIDEFLDTLNEKVSFSTRSMKWEFYFADHSRERLERLAEVLSASSYSQIEVWDPDPANDDKDLMFLHCSYVGVLTKQDVDTRCLKMIELARDLGVECFDGLDVGDSQ